MNGIDPKRSSISCSRENRKAFIPICVIAVKVEHARPGQESSRDDEALNSGALFISPQNVKGAELRIELHMCIR